MKQRALLFILAPLSCLLTGVAWRLCHPLPVASRERLEARSGADESVVTGQVENSAPPPSFKWAEVESDNYFTYISKLRSIGCPEATIQDIILCDVNKLYENRKLAEQSAESGHYWKTRQWNSEEERARQKKWRELDEEKVELLARLLGPEAAKDFEKKLAGPMARGYDFLPEAKQEETRKVLVQYSEQSRDIWARGILDESDMEELRSLRAQELAELGRFLTPEEVDETDLRTSKLSFELRRELRNFKPSEKEFRQIYAARKANEGGLGPVLDQEDEAALARHATAMAMTDRKIEQALGSERFGEYKRCNDFEYQNLVRLTDRHGLDKSAALAIYDKKRWVQEEFRKIRGDETLSDPEKNKALARLREETAASIQKTLKNREAWESYMTRQGSWLNRLQGKTEQTAPEGRP